MNLKKAWHFIIAHKLSVIIAAVLIISSIIACVIILANNIPNDTDADISGSENDAVEWPYDEIIVPEDDTLGSYLQTDIHTNMDNNIFMDSLIYTGYNITKHRDDGMLWEYVPSKSKAGLGYLSNISYGAGCSGYETDENCKPNIAEFEKGNLVCASYVTYVYFNYLPNVAGIDTSVLTKPTNSYWANSWYEAAKDWVNKGYSEYIPFTYEVMGEIGSSFIRFKSSREIPVGSIIVFCDPKTSMNRGAHVAVYAGYANGYDWLYHLGNANGPEFCSVQRMNFGPNARWPLAVITPPNILRFSPVLEIELKDDLGNPIVGSEFIIKHLATGKQESLGVTDENGKITKNGLTYGEFELIQNVPEGYINKKASCPIRLSATNNSLKTVSIINVKVP